MFSRTKLCACLLAAGAGMGTAAPLDVSGKFPLVSTGHPMALQIIQPSEKRARLSPASRPKKVKVHKISPSVQSPVRLEVNGFVFTKPAGVPAPAVPTATAGSEKK